MAAPRHSARSGTRSAAPTASASPASPAADPGTPRWSDPAASWSGQLVWQFISLWILGGCAPLVLTGMARGFKLGGTGATVVTGALLVVASLSFLALLLLLVRATPVVTPLGATPARRLVWALLVAFGGALTWFTGRLVASAHGLGFMHDGRLTVFLGGALMIPVAAALLLVALAGAGALAFRDNGPSDGDRRLTHFVALPVEAWVVDVPGYHRSRQTFGLGENGDEYLPDGAGGRIHLVAVSMEGTCAAGACADLPGIPEQAQIESDGEPAAVVRHGEVYLRLSGEPGVDNALLLRALANAHPATEAELVEALPEAPGVSLAEHLRSRLRRLF
jgi:hypothetical protein